MNHLRRQWRRRNITSQPGKRLTRMSCILVAVNGLQDPVAHQHRTNFFTMPMVCRWRALCAKERSASPQTNALLLAPILAVFGRIALGNCSYALLNSEHSYPFAGIITPLMIFLKSPGHSA